MFKIDASDMSWLDGKIDNCEDLCLHGHAVAFIGSIFTKISYRKSYYKRR